MLGRRAHPRFHLSKPVDGCLRLREDVAIKHWNGEEMVVLSPAPCRVEESLTLEIPGDAQRRLNVKVSDSRPEVTRDGSIRYRLRLLVKGLEPSAGPPEKHEL